MYEKDFVAAIKNDLRWDYFIEGVEQKHSRGFPDLMLIDLKIHNIHLIEVKVADKGFYDCRPDTRVLIKSLKPHQINWLESRCKIGGVIRPGIGMLLSMWPAIFYIRGDRVARWRCDTKDAPTFGEVCELASGEWFKKIDGDELRSILQ